MIKKYTLLFLLFNLFGFFSAFSQTENALHLMVFSKTNKFRHASIPAGKTMFAKMAADNNWKVSFSEDSLDFNDKYLADKNVIVMLSTTGTVFGTNEQNAFKKFMANGGGVVGIHGATDTEHNWPWYTNMIGARFKSHPKQQKVNIVTPKSNFPATAALPAVWNRLDELYNFKESVKSNCIVLSSLDETSYTGGTMGVSHPITWYQYYEGGRVFCTALGHTDASFAEPAFVNMIEKGIEWAGNKINTQPLTKKWTILLDDSLSNFDKFIGVPHISLTSLPDVAKGDGIKGAPPLGLNNDPLNVFSTIKDDGKTTLKITGEVYGGLSTKEEYENYHLSVKFKFGETKYAPRLKDKRDNGILYHCGGPYGAFWNVWMRCNEFQVQEGDMGDYFGLAGAYGTFPAVRNADSSFQYSNNGVLTDIGSGASVPKKSRLKRDKDWEKPHGQWNTLEIICLGDTSIHIVNGHVVNMSVASFVNLDGKILKTNRGKIQIQSEAAEAYYKEIKIKAITKIPRKILKQIKK